MKAEKQRAKEPRRFRISLSYSILAAVIAFVLLLSVVFSLVGYISFTASLTREYTDTGFRTANTAATLVDGNRMEAYLAGTEDDPDYTLTQQRMDTLCKKMGLIFVYVISVDTTDYHSFVCVFDSVNEELTDYPRWPLGMRRDTTNDEYQQIYRDLYENDLSFGTLYRTTNLNGADPHLTMLIPVKNDKGTVTALLCLQAKMQELVSGRKPYLINIVIATILFGFLIGAVAVIYMRKHFVSPLRKVTQEANRFASEKRPPQEALSGQISRILEISVLADSIHTMETDMLRYMENLTAVTAEKQRIGTELSIASQIQEGSVPSSFPAYPDRPEFDIYASMTPAKEVGGDFYDFFLVDDDHLAIVMADVSGKGIPAALFMMVTMILIKDRTLMGSTPGEILTFVNDRICESNMADMFVTVWLGIYEISTGNLIAANAGHDDPAVCRKGASFAIVKNRHGMVLGGMAGMKYRDFMLQLNPGDKLFLYTDGVPEASNANNQMLTIDGMLQALNADAAGSPQEILQTVWDKVNQFVADAPQFDDLTMLCLERKVTNGDRQMLKIEAKKENLDQVNDFVDSFLEAHDCPMKLQMQIDLCVEEVFVNIASYAYGTGSGEAEIRISEDNGVITLTFIDEGIPYDPLAKADPDTTLSAQERQIGGLGIFLVKKTMDTVSYRHEGGKNVLTMSKKIS